METEKQLNQEQVTETPIKRGRGRPFGSKGKKFLNKPTEIKTDGTQASN